MKYILVAFLVVLSVAQADAQEKWDLQRCVDYAIEHNIAVRQTQLNIERAETNLSQDKYGLLPDLNAGATYGYNWGQRIDPFTNQFATDRVRTNNLFMSSSFDLFDGLSKWNTVRAGRADLQAGLMDYEKAKNDISLQVSLLYLQTLVNKESVGVSQNQLDISEQQLDRMRILVEGGQRARGELYDIESQRAQEQLNLVNAQNAVDLSILNLTQLMQLPWEEAKDFDVVIPEISDQAIEMMSKGAEEIYAEASQNMPQIRAAEARKKVAEYSENASRGRLYPSLSVSASIGTGYSGINRELVGDGTNLGPMPIGQVVSTGETVVSLQNQVIYGSDDYRTKSFQAQLQDNLNQNLQFTLSIPIFNGMAARSNLKRAQINRLDADLNFKQVTDQLRFDIEQAYADAKASMNSYIAAQKAVEALEVSFSYAQARYEQNVITAVDFNNTKTQYTNAKISLLNAKYEFVFKLKVLDFYLGKPLTL